MTERRYSDDEIAAIFRAAAESPASLPPHPAANHGLTLADLQAIGREVGIAPDAVAQAAQALEVRRNAVSRTIENWLPSIARWNVSATIRPPTPRMAPLFSSASRKT